MLSLDPDYLRSFLAIQDTGSYGAAALQVNKTQSTISAQMKRLEDMLGATLFEKQGRRNVLTTAGRRLVEYARPIVRLNDETVRAFRPPDVSGTLRIGTSDDYAQAFLPPILMQFAQTHPAVEIAVVTGDAVALRQRARNEHFDALLISDGDPGAGAEPLRTDRLHWLGSERFCRHLDDRLPYGWRCGPMAVPGAPRPSRRSRRGAETGVWPIQPRTRRFSSRPCATGSASRSRRAGICPKG